MARDTDTILEQGRRQLPQHYGGAEALLAGIAAALAGGEATADTLQPLATVDGSTGKWLTLQARGQGIRRATNESDASLRIRMRTVEDALTVPAIKAAVDALIAPDACQIIEWWDGPYLDNEDASGCWLDNQDATLLNGPNSFIVLIPQQSTGFAWGSFLDDLDTTGMWLDSAYVGTGPEDPVYDAIVNEVERLRAAGSFWRLVIETEG